MYESCNHTIFGMFDVFSGGIRVYVYESDNLCGRISNYNYVSSLAKEDNFVS